MDALDILSLAADAENARQRPRTPRKSIGADNILKLARSPGKIAVRRSERQNAARSAEAKRKRLHAQTYRHDRNGLAKTGDHYMNYACPKARGRSSFRR